MRVEKQTADTLTTENQIEQDTSKESYDYYDKDIQTIILQRDTEDIVTLDLVNVVENMGRSWRYYAYMMLVVVCVGCILAGLVTVAQSLYGKNNYATAVITFNYPGIDKGLDPNGGLFDVSDVKSTMVIQEALDILGITDADVESIRSNIKIEGILPDSVKQQIAVINTVAEDAAEYYVNIENLDYFPSRYTVTLKKCKGMSGEETKELLDAILMSYREYFMDTYADMDTIGLATELLVVENYDYLQAADIIKNEIHIMENYVKAKEEQAPEFRANATGLSFSDLSSAIVAIENLDLNNFVSFVQSNNLTKDAGTQIDYYNYQIMQYNMEIQSLQNQLGSIEKMITEYEKDPVIVMSNQESVTETTSTNEYYDKLLDQKLELAQEINEINTQLNEAYHRVTLLNGNAYTAKDKDMEYADSMLASLQETVASWSQLVEKTVEEYYESELYADAYRIAIPAQYHAAGSLMDLIKKMVIFGGIGAAIVLLLWGFSGIKTELMRTRS